MANVLVKNSSLEKKALLHILDAKIQRQRLNDMKIAAKKRGINISETYNSSVTHLVTEFKDIDAVLRMLKFSNVGELQDTVIVTVQWFTECMKAAKVIEVQDQHRIKSLDKKPVEPTETKANVHVVGEYACQRATPLKHWNEQFTKALEILEKYATMKDKNLNYSRALAFRRASCVLKSLPFQVNDMRQIHHMTHIGEHSSRVIQGILEEGECLEVEQITNDPWFQKMMLFTEIFGIGPSKSKIFIENGWNTIRDVQLGYHTADWRVQWGLAFHDDLCTPVEKQEALYIVNLVRGHLNKLLPGAIMELTGGFRRGKEIGHDVDILITHPDEGCELGVLHKLIHSLQAHDILLYGQLENSTYVDDVLFRDTKLSAKGQLDHFEKWIGIIKVPTAIRNLKCKSALGEATESNCTTMNNDVEEYLHDDAGNVISNNKQNVKHTHSEGMNKHCDVNSSDRDGCNNKFVPDVDESMRYALSIAKTAQEVADESRSWTARRLDLVVSPYSQFFYGLFGWTGNKQFNRETRLYADRVLNCKLSSHGLYDMTKGNKIPARSEKEVFENLHLPYLDPWDRNC